MARVKKEIEDKLQIKPGDIDVMRVLMRNLHHIFPMNTTDKKEKVILGRLNKEFSITLPSGQLFTLPKGTVTMSTEVPRMRDAVLLGVDKHSGQPLSWAKFLEYVNEMKRKPTLTSAEKDMVEVQILLEPVFS